jgi:hypothetical protein
MWVVMSMCSEIGLTTLLGESAVELTWADGMVGAVPVFDTKAAADKYAMGMALVVEAVEILPEHTA